MVTNHTTMIGPNSRPTRSVPPRWMANRNSRIIRLIGTTQCDRCGATTLRPSTAPSTEIAGVITPSP